MTCEQLDAKVTSKLAELEKLMNETRVTNGRQEERWRNQSELNKSIDHRLGKIDNRISGMGTRIAYLAGGAAAVGGLVGPLIKLLGG